MKLSHFILVIFFGHTAYAGAAWAHHSVSAYFNTGESITINAILKGFHFVNPHPYAIADRLDADGEDNEWILNFDNRRELIEDGFSDLTLQPGDELIVTGSPARGGLNALYVRSIQRPSDGFIYVEDADEGRQLSDPQ